MTEKAALNTPRATGIAEQERSDEPAGGIQPCMKSERPETDGREYAAAGRFLRSLYILLRATALYEKSHPQVKESLA
jgi:hypothetical protein